MKIGQKTATSLIHRMTDVVTSHRTLARDLTYFGHSGSPKKFEARLYQSEPDRARKVAQNAQKHAFLV
jgi:hypothetical protein